MKDKSGALQDANFLMRIFISVSGTSKVRKKTAKVAWIAAFVMLCLLAGLIFRHIGHQSNGTEIPILPLDSQSGEYEFAAQDNSARRVMYPYSVIPGGAQNGSELASEINRDPVVAAHYSSFNVAKARAVAVRNESLVHVSYRINNKVFWTAKKVKLAQGERLITDGQNLARSRCGNRVSVLAQAPTSPDEPPAEVLDTPLAPAEPEAPGRALSEDLVSLLEIPKQGDSSLTPGFSLLSHDLLNPSIMTPAENMAANTRGTTDGGGMSALLPGASGISQPPIKGGIPDTSTPAVTPDAPPVSPGLPPITPPIPGSDPQPGTPDGGGGWTFPVVPPVPIPIPPGSNPGGGDTGGGSTPGVAPGNPDNPPPQHTDPPDSDSDIAIVPEAGTLALLGAGLATIILIRFVRSR